MYERPPAKQPARPRKTTDKATVVLAKTLSEGQLNSQVDLYVRHGYTVKKDDKYSVVLEAPASVALDIEKRAYEASERMVTAVPALESSDPGFRFENNTLTYEGRKYHQAAQAIREIAAEDSAKTDDDDDDE